MDTMIRLTVNGTQHQLDIEPETPLLWVVRDELGLTGTKFGCGVAQCGCCTVHVDGEAVRSCSLAVGDVDGKIITTIEGLSRDSKHPVQVAWLAEDVPQCGYCQSGQIMTSHAFISCASAASGLLGWAAIGTARAGPMPIASPPAAVNPVTMNWRRDAAAPRTFPSMALSSALHQRGGAVDRGADAWIGAAATDIGDAGVDVGVARPRVLF
jgi:isoquinoline 1-oxidoreductase alpha subunit